MTTYYKTRDEGTGGFYVSISMMKQHASSSVEELRWRSAQEGHAALLRRVSALLAKPWYSVVSTASHDKPQWWRLFQEDECKLIEWIEDFVVHVTLETLREAVGRHLLRLYPVASRVSKRRAEEGGKTQLSDLLDEWTCDFAGVDPYDRVTQACLREVFETNALSWPENWGRDECACSNLQPLVDENARRCLCLIDSSAPVEDLNLEVFLNIIRADMEKVRSRVQDVWKLSIKPDVVEDIVPGPVDHFFLTDSCFLGSKELSLLESSLGSSSHLLDIAIADDASVSILGECDESLEALRSILPEIMTLMERSLLSASKAKQMPPRAVFKGNTHQVVLRMQSSGEFSAAPAWVQATYDKHRHGPVVATALVVLNADQQSPPVVQLRPEGDTTDRVQFFENPSVACCPRGGVQAQVTGYCGRVMTFPQQLPYRIVEASDTHGLTKLLTVQVVEPVEMSDVDDLDEYVVSWNSVWSAEEQRLAHKWLHQGENLSRPQSALHWKITPTKTWPLSFRKLELDRPNPLSSLETAFQSWLGRIIDKPRWWESVYGSSDELNELVSTFRTQYTRLKVKDARDKCLGELKSLVSACAKQYHVTHIPIACWREVRRRFPHLAWFEALCESDPTSTLYYPCHYEPTTVIDTVAPVVTGISLPFMNAYASYSVEELRFQRLPKVSDIRNQGIVDPYTNLVWLVAHTKLLAVVARSEDLPEHLEALEKFNFLPSIPTLTWDAFENDVESAYLPDEVMKLLMVECDEISELSVPKIESALVRAAGGSVPDGVLDEMLAQALAIQHDFTTIRTRVNSLVCTMANKSEKDTFTQDETLERVVADGLVPNDVNEAIQRHCDVLSTRFSADCDAEEQEARLLVDPCMYSTDKSSTKHLPVFTVPRASTTAEMRLCFDRLIGKEGDIIHSTIRQWIPADVRIRLNGSVEFLSYINNLHPHRDQQMYLLVARVFAAMVPLLERVATQLTGPSPKPVFLRSNPTIYHTTTREFDEPARFIRSFSLRGRVVQAVVALHEVRVDGSNCLGDVEVWHRDDGSYNGLLATGLYVVETTGFDTTPSWSFQRPIYGSNGSKLLKVTEEIPSITCHSGRMVVLPNYYRQRMLINPPSSQLGRVRVLAIYLLDPTQPKVSSAEIPPQQREWIYDAVVLPVAHHGNLPSDLHNTLKEMIGDVGWSHEDAVSKRGSARGCYLRPKTHTGT
ncbi:hypothetical protein Poli38472_006835 [Pythium oligandrum]|uniref:DUF4246 domain-containing protein n=1 Tax=Pythium oligandrum TaxID=41045 RepID=A0A8K1C5P7_PYTOL|nr:hypothetical protein Poli38472_006835 [Pythium oligandrum]|eukprot:TMW56825.1 hypothetical protein Poli38472_006835 [Pythium oligandrum]